MSISASKKAPLRNRRRRLPSRFHSSSSTRSQLTVSPYSPYLTHHPSNAYAWFSFNYIRRQPFHRDGFHSRKICRLDGRQSLLDNCRFGYAPSIAHTERPQDADEPSGQRRQDAARSCCSDCESFNSLRRSGGAVRYYIMILTFVTHQLGWSYSYRCSGISSDCLRYPPQALQSSSRHHTLRRIDSDKDSRRSRGSSRQ